MKEEKRIKNILKSQFYWPVPGFRYSISILSGISVGIYMVYILALITFKIYFQLITNVSQTLRDLLDSNDENLAKRFAIFAILRIDEKSAFNEIRPYFEEALFWTDAVAVSIYVSIIGSVLLTSISLLLSLQNYRKHLLYLYRGVYNGIPRRDQYSPRSIVVLSTKYVGYQFSYAAWGYILQGGALLILSITITVFIVAINRYKLFNYVIRLLEQFGPVLVYLVLLQLFQHLIVQFVFLLKGTDGRRVLGLDNRRLFFNFQYFMIFANAPLGFFACLFRILKGLIFGLITIPRLDVSTLSRKFERFDNGFDSYVAMVKLDNAMTNPVMLVFINLLIESYKNRPICSEKIKMNGDFTSRSSKNRVSSMHCGVARSNIIRNRWHLFITLHNNLILRSLRGHYLAVSSKNSKISIATSMPEVIYDPGIMFLLKILNKKRINIV